METQDGFIVGVYNYCDRWCEGCHLTSHCRLFADGAEFAASLDPNLQAVIDAPPIPEETPEPPPRWLQEHIQEMNEASQRPMSTEELERLQPKVLPEHLAIDACSRTYFTRVMHYCERHQMTEGRDPSDPRAIVRWFAVFLGPKVHRALTGLADHDDDGDELGPPHDHDGSAKAALLGIDRSHSAWLRLVESGVCAAADVLPFVDDLVWLGERLESVFPNARAFVRPGLDEPDEVEKLMAAD